MESKNSSTCLVFHPSPIAERYVRSSALSRHVQAQIAEHFVSSYRAPDVLEEDDPSAIENLEFVFGHPNKCSFKSTTIVNPTDQLLQRTGNLSLQRGLNGQTFPRSGRNRKFRAFLSLGTCQFLSVDKKVALNYVPSPMKRCLLFSVAILFIVACGSENKNPVQSEPKKPEEIKNGKPIVEKKIDPPGAPLDMIPKSALEGDWQVECESVPRTGRYVLYWVRQAYSFRGKDITRKTEYFRDDRCEKPDGSRKTATEKGTFEIKDAPAKIDDTFTLSIAWVREIDMEFEGKHTYSLVGVHGTRFYVGFLMSGSRDFYSRKLDPDSNFRKN